MMVDSSKPRFPCPHCDKSFSRAEHLTRHNSIHINAQSFSCEHCQKKFPRKDALNRHELTHSGGPNLLEKKARACLACARAKVRCNGEKPCLRCNNKALDCEFPQPRPHQTTSPSVQNSSPGSVSRSTFSEGTLTQPDFETGQNERTMSAPDQPSGVSIHSPEVAMNDYVPDVRGSMSIQTQQNDERFDSSYWTPAMLSSINWLPINPSPSTGYENLLSPLNLAQSPTLSQHTMIPPIPENMPIENHNMGTPHTMSSITDSLGNRSTASGEYYVDGNAGRLPRIKRQKIIARRPSELRSRNFGWRLFWLPPISRDAPVGRHFADFEYDEMRQAYVNLCVQCAPVMTPFVSDEFPPIEAFDHLMHLFFKYVHPTTPFVHRPTFNPDHEGRWILLLSMVSASCWYLDDETSDDFAESMLEFLRRVTLFYDSSNAWQKTFTNCRQAQIRLLFLLSASASRDEAVKVWSDRCMGELCYLVNTSICQSYPKAQYERAGMPVSAEWIDWSEHEQTIRTAFLVWQIGLLKSMQSLDGRPPVSLDSIARIRLPCMDDMFEAPDAETWQLCEEKSSPTTFQEALQNLYLDKKLLPNLGDLSHVLLVYGVIQRTKDIQDLVRQPMSLIEPSAERQNSSELSLQAEWAPGAPLFMKWRNAACDCLDILHWQANAAIGMAGGIEPTKVMHLHFSRILMLVPLQELLNLARLVNFPFRSSADTGAPPPEEMELKRAIQRWAISDQYKARLAAIHAGVTFWHVRRYSTNAFYEPLAVLGATLTLWALSTFSAKMNLPAQSPAETGADGESCDIILIDRPTDDELVQQFVRQGQYMRVHMNGVENLWSPSAPYKILGEGKKLLSTLGAWTGETVRAVALLDGLMMTSLPGT